MELKHYSLSQLLTTFSNEYEIKVRLEQGEASVGVELYKEAGVQVRDLSYRLGALLKPVEAEIMSKRLYKLRLGRISSSKERNVYQSAIKDTKLTVEVWRPCVEFAADTPCVALDLSKKVEAPAVAINVGEPRPAANGDTEEDVKTYSLRDIILPLQTAFSLRFDFSRVKEHSGLEKCGFICKPDMDHIAIDLNHLKTSVSPEMVRVFDEIENMKFILFSLTCADDTAAYIATKGDATIRVIVSKDAAPQEPKPAAAVGVEPKTIKETFISWLRKIIS